MPSAKKKKQKRAAPSEKKRRKKDAAALAGMQRDISVSEFFSKNRHLLGFDNPRKALLTTVKEGVDNSMDACEEAGILPDILVQIEQTNETRFVVRIQDNGPGIVKKQIPMIFAKLLYGSKFHRLKMSRGQQGIGISAAGMYGQLTTGKPVKIISRTSTRRKAHYFELVINTQKNKPDILKDEEVEWDGVDHGTLVEIELEGKFLRGRQSVDEYLKEMAVANPHARIVYQPPDSDEVIYERTISDLPDDPKEIKPHPYGVELGLLMKMLKGTRSRTVSAFLKSEFSRVSPKVASEICERAGITNNTYAGRIANRDIENLYKAIQETRILNPPMNCICPIGEEAIISGLKKEIEADFYVAKTRGPAVYRGNPFLIEAGVAYGGKQSAEDSVRILRFANRVPLLYQQSACATFKAVTSTNWRNYSLHQPKGALPIGPITIFIHIASVWVPFTSESKEAIAHYPEILEELRLGLQDVGRRLGAHISKRKREAEAERKRSYIEKYIPHIGAALQEIIGFTEKEEDKICDKLETMLRKAAP